MEDYQLRVIEEKKQLDEKREKLSAFLNSEAIANLDSENKRLLRLQLFTMNDYSLILSQRIEPPRLAPRGWLND